MATTETKNGTGRRKTSVARVYLRQGEGNVTINGRPLDTYFQRKDHVYVVRQPLEATDNAKSYDFVVTVRGGGLSGQAGAVRHGIARALIAVDETNRPALKANGFLRRDPRMVERKKYGQRGARRRFQFSKR